MTLTPPQLHQLLQDYYAYVLKIGDPVNGWMKLRDAIFMDCDRIIARLSNLKSAAEDIKGSLNHSETLVLLDRNVERYINTLIRDDFILLNCELPFDEDENENENEDENSELFIETQVALAAIQATVEAEKQLLMCHEDR
jgi:hypothetical protein